MSDIDDLVRRCVDGLTVITRKATAFATRLLLGVVVVCVGGFWLGVQALSGGIETVWIVLAFTFAAIAIGSAVVARWRVGSVRRHLPELAAEVRTLATEDPSSTRTVVEAFVVDTDVEEASADEGGTGRSAIVMSRQMGGFRNVADVGDTRTVRLNAAVRAMTSFPFLVLAAIMISFVFAFLGLIFLVALAL